jgi:hypothetical protein
MNADQASLERLHDIVAPPLAPWWPPAPGWLWLLGMLVVLAVVLLVRGAVYWQRNRYRREALAELAQITAATNPTTDVDKLWHMAHLLKRTALTAYTRQQVASVTGPVWFAFLDRTGGTHFSDGLGAALEQAIYQGDSTGWDTARVSELGDEVRCWIRHHEVVPSQVCAALLQQNDTRRAQTDATPPGAETERAP